MLSILAATILSQAIANTDGPPLAAFGIRERFFMQRSTVPFRGGAIGDDDLLFDFGVTKKEFARLSDRVCRGAYLMPHRPELGVKGTAERLIAMVDGLWPTDSARKPLLRNWLVAESICAYVISHIRFDGDGASQNSFDMRLLQERPFAIFAMRQPVAVCSGFSKIATELATAAGLKCCTINGVCRWANGQVVKDDNHSWVMFDLGEGVRVPADVTPMHPVQLAQYPGKFAWHCLPSTPKLWELFMRMHWPLRLRPTPMGKYLDAGKEMFGDYGQNNPKLDIELFRCTWEEWVSRSQPGYIDLENWYVARSYGTKH